MITGAAGNIGRAAALYFCRAGAQTVLMDVTETPLQDLVEEVSCPPRHRRLQIGSVWPSL